MFALVTEDTPASSMQTPGDQSNRFSATDPLVNIFTYQQVATTHQLVGEYILFPSN